MASFHDFKIILQNGDEMTIEAKSIVINMKPRPIPEGIGKPAPSAVYAPVHIEWDVVEPTVFAKPIWLGYSDLYPPSPLEEMYELFPKLSSLSSCPGCDRQDSIARTVMHLNDAHRWTRELIADWIDTLPVDLTIHPKEQDAND